MQVSQTTKQLPTTKPNQAKQHNTLVRQTTNQLQTANRSQAKQHHTLVSQSTEPTYQHEAKPT
jgi:hypothetical protein